MKKQKSSQKTKGRFFIRNSIIFSCVFFIVIIIFGIKAFHSNIAESDRQITEASLSAIENTKEANDEIFSDITKKIIDLSVMSDVKFIFLDNKNNELYFQKNTDVLKILKIYFQGNNSVNSVYVYNNAKNYVITGSGTVPVRYLPDTSWINEYEKMEKYDLNVVFRQKDNEKITVATFLYRAQKEEIYDGGIVVNLDINKSMPSKNSKSTQLIIDRASGKIVYSNNSNITQSMLNELLKHKNSITRYDKKYFSVAAIPSEYIAYDFVTVDLLENYGKNRLFTYFYSILILLALIMVFYIVALFLANILYRPINELTSLVDNPFSQETKKYLENDVNTKKIADKLFLVVSNNEKLQNELNKKMETLNYAQLKALQWQINPHFIFNTLNMLYYISTKATTESSPISKGIMSLSKLMRYCLKTDSESVALSEELKNAEEYLKIIKSRVGDNFEIVWKTEEEHLDNKIVKMTIQPILENCFRYGFEETNYKGIIVIETKKEDGFFKISISDNGKGFEKEKVSELNKLFSESPYIPEKHIGLFNVNSRISLIYGEEYGLEIHSEKNKGTTVTMKFPDIH